MHYWTARLLLGCLLLLPHLADAAPLTRGMIIEVTRSTQAFSRPSRRASVLADIDAGAKLMLLKLSPRALWLYAENADGYKVWLASAHTNFSQIRQMQKANLAPPKASTDSKQARRKDSKADDAIPDPRKAKASKRKLRHELAGVYRRSWVDPYGPLAYGPVYTLYFLESLWAKKKRASAGLQIGYLFNNDYEDEFMVPIRLRYLAQNQDSIFILGPDLGFNWTRAQPKRNHFNFSLGYSMGISLGDTFLALVRPGVDLFYATRFSLELSVGLKL